MDNTEKVAERFIKYLNLDTASYSLGVIRDLSGAEVLAGALVANGEALEDLGGEGEDLCRAARHGVLGERSNRRCVDLVMVPHIQAVVVLEVTGIGEVGNLCIKCIKIMSQIKYYKNNKIEVL